MEDSAGSEYVSNCFAPPFKVLFHVVGSDSAKAGYPEQLNNPLLGEAVQHIVAFPSKI